MSPNAVVFDRYSLLASVRGCKRRMQTNQGCFAEKNDPDWTERERERERDDDDEERRGKNRLTHFYTALAEVKERADIRQLLLAP